MDDLDKLMKRLVEQLDLEDTPETFEHGGELLRTYGEAMLHAQLIERSLKMLLVLRRYADTGDPETIDLTLHEIRRDSMGSVLQRLEEKFKIKKGASKRYNNATARRNHLAHDFFLTNFRDVLSEYGRDRLIPQLKLDIDYFKHVGKSFDSLVGRIFLEIDPTLLDEAIGKYFSGEVDIDGTDTLLSESDVPTA